MIDYGNFSKSLKNLELQHEHRKHLDPALPQFIHEGMAESVIQRFETCYDALHKVLRRYLQEELGVAEAPRSPRPIFRLADANNLLSSPFPQWNEYIQARIDTTHDYSGEKAEQALALVDDFVDDAIGLYQTMTGETWE